MMFTRIIPRRLYCTPLFPLPELEKAAKAVHGNKIDVALSDIERAEQICKYMGEGNPVYPSVLEQKYWSLLYSRSPQQRKKIPSVLESICSTRSSFFDSLAWKQVLHRRLLLDADFDNAARLLDNLGGHSEEEKTIVEVRHAIGTSRAERCQGKDLSVNLKEIMDNFDGKVSKDLFVELLCEQGDILLTSNPLEAMDLYKKAIDIYNCSEKDDTFKILEIRRARGLLEAAKMDKKLVSDCDSHVDAITSLLTHATNTQSRFRPEITCILGSIFLYKDAKFVYAEGLGQKALELLHDSNLLQLPYPEYFLLLIESKQLMKQLAKTRGQDSLVQKIQAEIDGLLQHKNNIEITPKIPYSIEPVIVQNVFERFSNLK